MQFAKAIPDGLPTTPGRSDGWLVEVLVPRLRSDAPTQLLYAAAIDDKAAAVRAVRAYIGGLHCSIEAKCRLALRALVQLGVTAGGVASL